jgi:hypothetical protein
MTWSYDTSLTAAKDQVRFYSSDTESAAAITLTDEEIGGALTLAGTARAAAALCCETLAGRYASFGQRFVDDLGETVDYGARATFFAGRATQLRSRISLSAIPFAGGLSVSGKQTQEEDTDRVQPAFTKDLHEARELRTSDDRIERP